MLSIHYECKPEECLLTNLNLGKSLAQHHNGSGSVCDFLSKHKNSIGWIDEDPASSHHPYYKSMVNAKIISDKHGLKYCYDPQLKNKLIIVKPKLEDWITTLAKRHKLDLVNYNLSNDADELHGIISFRINKFQEVIHQLLKLKSPALVHAQLILTEKRK